MSTEDLERAKKPSDRIMDIIVAKGLSGYAVGSVQHIEALMQVLDEQWEKEQHK